MAETHGGTAIVAKKHYGWKKLKDTTYRLMEIDRGDSPSLEDYLSLRKEGNPPSSQ